MKSVFCLLIIVLSLHCSLCSKAKSQAKMKISSTSFLEEHNRLMTENLAQSRDSLRYALRLQNLNTAA